MLEGIHFSYDGVYSYDKGLLNCKVDGGMFDETFLPSREIIETKISGRDKPYFQSVNLEPISFDLVFAFEYYYDEKLIREVARWLMQPYYKPFYTVDNPNRIFYCMYEGDSRLVHNGLKQGYIKLTMRCDSPYSYTPKSIKENMTFGGTKLTKTGVENTFTYGAGEFENIDIHEGKMSVRKTDSTWASLIGKKWSDL